jgi:hypothetical protein
MYFKEIRCEDMELIQLNRDNNQWHDLLNKIMKLPSETIEKFLEQLSKYRYLEGAPAQCG